MKKEDFEFNANFIILKNEIEIFKKLLNQEQKHQFNDELKSREKLIVGDYKDNKLLSKSDLQELFEKALIKV